MKMFSFHFRSAAPREAAERRRKRTSKNADADGDKRRSHQRPEPAAGDGGSAVSVSDVHPDVDLSSIPDPPAVHHQQPDRSDENHVLNGHVDAVAKDASAALPGDSMTSAADVGVLPPQSSDQKAVKTSSAVTSDFDHAVNGYTGAPGGVAKDAKEARVDIAKDSDHLVNGHTEPPAAVVRDDTDVARDYKEAPGHVAKDKEARVIVAKDVARDATDAEAGLLPSSGEDRREAGERGTDTAGQQVTSLSPVSIDQQTDIKPVNPDMAIFGVLHRQQASKSLSASEDSEAPSSSVDPNHSSAVETQPTVVNDRYCKSLNGCV